MIKKIADLLFKYFDWFRKNLWILLICIGSINSILFINKSPLLLKTKRIPISPIALAFDSPKGFHYWAYQYIIHYQTNKSSGKVPLDANLLKHYPRSVMVSSFYTVIIGGAFINPNEESNNFLKEILCYSTLKIYGFVPKNENILKIKIEITDPFKKPYLTKEILCQ